jgi:hypothetical protein
VCQYEDKQELLKQFVLTGENLEKIETVLTVSKEQDASVETKKELLTIAEMKTRGFSEYLAAIIADVFLFGFNPKKTRFRVFVVVRFSCGCTHSS